MLKDLLNKFHIDEHHARASWGNNLEYYLSCIGFAVGFGSLWRFPYVVFANGGGAFLIPYFFFFFVLAFPLFYLESALGQMYQQGAPACLQTAGKKYRGVGLAQLVVSFFLGSFYNILMAYSLIFLWKSFSWHLPWKINDDEDVATGTLWDDEYFYKDILQVSSGIEELGGFNYQVLFASIISFVIVYFCTVNGIKTSGKVVYVSAPLPYILLFILLARGLFLDGAWDGIAYLFDVDWSKLWTLEIWYRAANQVIFQYSLAIASLHALASYKEKHQPLKQSAFIVPGVTAFTGILCGLTVFAYMGHMAKVAGVHIKELPLSGPELVFVAYPAALALMPGSTFWAILFFIMLYFLGIDTEFCFVETVGGFFEDERIRVFGRFIRLQVLRVLLVVGFFVLGIFLYTKAGFYFLSVYDDYSTMVPLTVSATLECLIFGWLHGTEKLETLIKENTKEEIPQYVKICLKYVALPVLILMAVSAFWQVVIVNLFALPWFAIVLGLFLTGLPLATIVIYYLRHKDEAPVEFQEESMLVELANF